MAKMMKAAVVHQFGKPLVIEDVPVPVPGAGEILVRVMACGVCHTDLHAAEGDWPVKPSLPFIPGHEVAGVVTALGPGVTDFKPGDAVGVAWLHDACMRCEYCETGWETVCEHQHNTGYSCDGGFAEYVVSILLRTNLLLPEPQAPTSRLTRAHRTRWPIFSRRAAAAPTGFW